MLPFFRHYCISDNGDYSIYRQFFFKLFSYYKRAAHLLSEWQVSWVGLGNIYFFLIGLEVKIQRGSSGGYLPLEKLSYTIILMTSPKNPILDFLHFLLAPCSLVLSKYPMKSFLKLAMVAWRNFFNKKINCGNDAICLGTHIK